MGSGRVDGIICCREFQYALFAPWIMAQPPTGAGVAEQDFYANYYRELLEVGGE